MLEMYDGNDFVGVFLATEAGRNGGIDKVVYVMNLKDGIKFCTHPDTRKYNWAFHWTILSNFVDNTGKLSVKHFKKKNDGRFDSLMNELGIVNYEFNDLKDTVFKDLDETLSDERLGKALQSIEDEKDETK